MAESLIIAHSPEEAVRAHSAECAYLAGGTEALHLGSPFCADSYVSVRRTESMRTVAEESGSIRIGASCTFQELVENELVPGYLKKALLFMASRTRRNMATIGGNIASCRDDSFLIPVLIAAAAELELMDQECSTSKVTAEKYVLDRKSYDGKLITAVMVPADASVVSIRSANTAQSHARLTAAMSLAGGSYKAAAAVKNAGIFVFDDLTKAFGSGSLSEDAILEMVRNYEGISLEDDLLYGSAAYRRYLLGIELALMYEELNGKGGKEL